MKYTEKIKGGAIQYVLIISIVIGILLFAFISLIYLQQKMTSKYRFSKEAIHNAQIAFDYLKVKNIPYDIRTKIQALESPISTTIIQKKHWGIFDLGMVHARVKNEEFFKAAILGAPNSNKKALILKDNHQALVLVGSTKISGDVLIPKQGVKSGNIAGVSYGRDQFIYGSSSPSSSSLPKIKNSSYIKGILKNHSEIDGEYFELQEGMQVHRSFNEKTGIYHHKDPINLVNISLSGNIIIQSETAIRVTSSAKLEDLILIAPKIKIESNTRGVFQAIASKNIEVQSGCKMEYPSALILLGEANKDVSKNPKDKLTQIRIASNSTVKGVLVSLSDQKTGNYDAQISLQEKSILIGQVYCTSNLELFGTVYGGIYTDSFLVKKSGGIYINHLYNAVIDARKLDANYVGLPITKTSNTVAKWVQ